ncbi:MAG: hypothetical protein WA151_04010 [Desulfatirhabdiaceae bacterium]
MQSDYTPKHKKFIYRFDFEIGYLVKSPCRDCHRQEDIPKCIDRCAILERIHEALSTTIPCGQRHS